MKLKRSELTIIKRHEPMVALSLVLQNNFVKFLGNKKIILYFC